MKPRETVYFGCRDTSPCSFDEALIQMVMVDGDCLHPGPSRKLRDHSTDFAWGYAGSGPAQLALAILLDYLEGEADRDAQALHHYQTFKRDHVRFWEESGFTIYGGQIADWLITAQSVDPCEQQQLGDEPPN